MKPSLPHLLSALILALGVLVIIGYWTQTALLVQVLPDAVPMAFNTAVGFIITSTALMVTLADKPRVARWCTGAALILPSITLSEYLLGTNIGVDNLFAEAILIVETAHPGRMAPQTAVCFILTCFGLFSLNASRGWRLKYLAACWCGMVITLLGLLAFLGYVFNVQSLYGWGYYPRMAIHTAVGFALFGVALVGSTFRNDTKREYSVSAIRARLLAYSLSGALFIGIFSSNAALLPSFSYLERAARQSLELSALHKSSIVVEWMRGLEENLAQMSSRTEVKKNFEAYLEGKVRLQELQRLAMEDMQDALSASVNVLGMCRVRQGRCIFGAGLPITEEEVSRATKEEGFLHGPFAREGRTFFVARHHRVTSSGKTQITDLYLVDAIALLGALKLNAKGHEQVFLSIPKEQGGWSILAIDPTRQRINLTTGDEHVRSALTLSNTNASGTFQTDVSVKNGVIIGYSSVASLGWTLITKAALDDTYEGVTAWLMTAMSLVGAVIVFGSVGMVLLLRPLQRQMFFHANLLEEKITEKTTELQRATQYKSQFLANMSHEIRTPLTAILGFGEQLQDPDIGESTANDSVQAIIRNGRHLFTLVNDILDFSKIEAGRLEVEHIEFSLTEVIYDAMQVIEPRSTEKELDLSIEISLPVPETVYSDPTRVRQILLNLMSNAVKFTEKGGVKIYLECDQAREVVRLKVKDSGIGLDSGQLSRLFSPFNQADASTTRKFGGTGLGLAITHQLITMLGGTVEVESEPNVGTTFIVELPIGTSCPRYLTELPKRDFGPSSANATPPALSGSVLLAEDSDDIRTMVSYLVKKTGAKIEFASNGVAALEALDQRAFDLVLMDMQMPLMDGYTATSLLRTKGYKGIVVGLTANTVGGGLQRCLEAGCDDAMGKPFKAESFYKLLEAHLQLRTTTDALDEEEDPIARAMLTQFAQKLPGRVQDLRQLFTERKWDNLKGDAHKLAGSAGLYGLGSVSEIASQLEQAAKRGDEKEMAVRLEHLENELARRSGGITMREGTVARSSVT